MVEEQGGVAKVGFPGSDGERGDIHSVRVQTFNEHLLSAWMALGARDTLINIIPILAKLTCWRIWQDTLIAAVKDPEAQNPVKSGQIPVAVSC